MSRQRTKNRPARGHTAARARTSVGKPTARGPVKASRPRTPAGKKRGRAPVGRPDGPLARRRRFRIRLLLALLLVVNVAAWVVWHDWSARLAVLIVSIITAPLLAALLLRRRR